MNAFKTSDRLAEALKVGFFMLSIGWMVSSVASCSIEDKKAYYEYRKVQIKEGSE